MKKYVSFLPTGQIQSVGTCADSDLQLQPGYPNLLLEVSLAANVSWDTHYVENGQVVAMPVKPDGEHTFDYAAKTWQPNVQRQGNEIKILRNALLTASDWTQIPNSPLSAEKQTAWATYRQELRDIPSQTGFPFNVVWPTPPA